MARAPSSLGIDFTPEVMAGIFVVVVVVVNCLLNIFFVWVTLARSGVPVDKSVF